jgi:hypothetical protein
MLINEAESESSALSVLAVADDVVVPTIDSVATRATGPFADAGIIIDEDAIEPSELSSWVLGVATLILCRR